MINTGATVLCIVTFILVPCGLMAGIFDCLLNGNGLYDFAALFLNILFIGEAVALVVVLFACGIWFLANNINIALIVLVMIILFCVAILIAHKIKEKK